MAPISSKKARLYYIKASGITGYTNYGDKPTQALLEGEDWKQYRMESALSQVNFLRDPYLIPQNSSEILSDLPEAGLMKPDLTIDLFHTADFVAKHIDLLKSGLGTLVESTGDTTISTVTNTTTIIVASATGFAIGDVVEIQDATGNNKAFAEIENIVSTTLTLRDAVSGMVATDKVIGRDYFNTRELQDDEYYHLFLTTDLGNFFILWCKPSFDIITTKDELAKMTLKLQGDWFEKTTTEVADLNSVTTNAKSTKSTNFNFKRVSVGADTCRKVITSTFSITRENTRIPSQCTTSMQGNGGTYNEPVKATLELTLIGYTDNYVSYETGTELKVAAYNDKIAIFGTGKISSFTHFNEADMQIRPILSLELNAIESKPLKVVL